MTRRIKVKQVSLEKRLQITRSFNGGLHSLTRRTLLASRYMGLLPLSGLRNTESNQLRFTLRSPYSLLYLASILGQIIMFTMSLYLLTQSISLANFTNAVFYSSNLTSILMLYFLGRSWSTFIQKVEIIEKKLPPFTKNLTLYCDLTMIIVLIGTAVEHMLSILYGLTVVISCNSTEIFETYFQYNAPWIFKYTSVSLWKGLLCEITNFQSTFMWSFSDLIIIQLSIYLGEHFDAHNKLLKNNLEKNNYCCDAFREQYMLIVKLTKMTNNLIGVYILTSFGGNLYWICMQLFNNLNKSMTGHFVACHMEHAEYLLLRGLEHTIYFTYSFAFLVMKTLLVLFLAARVHSFSMDSLIILYEVPTGKLNLEVTLLNGIPVFRHPHGIIRFIDQINNLNVALSGLDFFYVTKTMILTLLGTIVTYELVLLQFNK